MWKKVGLKRYLLIHVLQMLLFQRVFETKQFMCCVSVDMATLYST